MDYFNNEFILKGHSNLEDEEKRADGHENGLTRKGRRRMPCSTAAALCLSSASQCWVRIRVRYSDWLILFLICFNSTTVHPKDV